MEIRNKIEYPNGDWQNGNTKNVTFIVTEDCQLRCRYCYIIGKNTKNVMSFDIAKESLEYLLTRRDIFSEDSVILDFIGGEPLLEIETIEKICNYFKFRSFELDHPWFDRYRISLSSNGLLYDNTRVQKFIAKNRNHVSLGISIDGTKQKHDNQRIYPNGTGSYDIVVKKIPLWLQQFPNASTKVTISHEDLPFVSESVLHLCELGIKNININCVFEPVWKENDEKIFEEELIKLADSFITNKLYQNHFCSFFSRTIGKPIQSTQNWCGVGRMLAIDPNGNFFPCVRFAPYSLTNKSARCVGNIKTGIDKNKLRPFLSLDLPFQSEQECIECEVATGCSWCQGANYDLSTNDSVFYRATSICKLHKARVKANNYFWNKYDRIIREQRKSNEIHAPIYST